MWRVFLNWQRIGAIGMKLYSVWFYLVYVLTYAIAVLIACKHEHLYKKIALFVPVLNIFQAFASTYPYSREKHILWTCLWWMRLQYLDTELSVPDVVVQFVSFAFLSFADTEKKETQLAWCTRKRFFFSLYNNYRFRKIPSLSAPWTSFKVWF